MNFLLSLRKVPLIQTLLKRQKTNLRLLLTESISFAYFVLQNIYFELRIIIYIISRITIKNLVSPKAWRYLNFRIRQSRHNRYRLAVILDVVLILIILVNGIKPAERILTPLVSPLQPITQDKATKEVFGFAPYWNFNKLDNIDFQTLTTLAYFGIEVDSEGNLVKNDPGYETFKSKQASELFKKAHQHGTRVVLTLTQMSDSNILSLMDNPNGQSRAIEEAVKEVKNRGIDGINLDFEYSGDPGQYYRDRFSLFAEQLAIRMHEEVAGSKVTVSVYASAVKDPKIYDIASLSKTTDGIFMMAYDFAVAGSDNAIPTAPLYGHKEGKYWYDIATAVDDFLKYMPSTKLILGVPYYGYNYHVYKPEVKAQTRRSFLTRAKAQTYTVFQSDITTNNPNVLNLFEGWDDFGKVGYKAYYALQTGTWRMIFMDDYRSLGYKYDFANEKNLAGVGVWALGNDENKNELWSLLKEKFGLKEYADTAVSQRTINEPHE